MTNVLVGFKERFWRFANWYFNSNSGWGFIITIIIVVSSVLTPLVRNCNKRAEVVGHPSYTNVKINVWVPRDAIFGPFAEGGLSYHDASFTEMMAIEKMFKRHYIDCSDMKQGNGQNVCTYYFKNDSDTTVYRSNFGLNQHVNSNDWWEFNKTSIIMKDGELFERGKWVSTSQHSSIVVIALIVAVIIAIGGYIWGQEICKKKHLENFKR